MNGVRVVHAHLGGTSTACGLDTDMLRRGHWATTEHGEVDCEACQRVLDPAAAAMLSGPTEQAVIDLTIPRADLTPKLEAIAEPVRRGGVGGPPPQDAADKALDVLLGTPRGNPEARIKALLRVAVQVARRNVRTEADHAGYPNHRADERVRDLLEDVIHGQ